MIDYTALNSDADVEALSREIKIRETAYSQLFILAMAYAFGGALVTGCISPRASVISTVFGMSCLFALWFACELLNRIKTLRPHALNLQPLSKSQCCVAALELCSQYEVARAIRDRALANGRQLYGFDYSEMLRATSAVRARVLEQHKREAEATACRTLHGLASQTNE